MYLNDNITAAKIFIVISCYTSLRMVLTIRIPIGIVQLAEARTAMKRLKSLLMQPELEEQTDQKYCIKTTSTKITINNAIAALNGTTNIFKGINLDVKNGLVAVTGPLGSGKSCLLKLILKDLKLVQGDIKVRGTTSYSSQEPWLFPGTIRQNILFGEPFNGERYNKVLQICALDTDLERFPESDHMMVIDKGLNLSRGQQARVNLARAIYKEADIYLLDDCLSSLDSKVSAHIFQHCIKNFLKDKLCLLVVHKQQYLKEADKIIYLKEGQIEAEGTYSDLIESNIRKELLKNQIDFDHHVDVPCEEDAKEIQYDESSKLLNKKGAYYEEKKEGKVGWGIYKVYFKSGGGWLLILLIVLLCIAGQFTGSYFDYYVAQW